MKVSKQARRTGKALFRACLVEGVLDEARVRQTVARVLAQKPRSYFAILSHFQRLVKLDLERHTARVESPLPLPNDLQSRIQGNLNRLYGQGLTIRFLPKPALIGGLRVQIGSDVYDGSIQTRLRQLEVRFDGMATFL